MDMTGGLAPAITASVQAVIAQVPGIEKLLDDEKNSLVQSMAALLQKASAVVQADLKPAVDESAAWRALISQGMNTLATGGIEGTIGGIPFTLRAVQPKS